MKIEDALMEPSVASAFINSEHGRALLAWIADCEENQEIKKEFHAAVQVLCGLLNITKEKEDEKRSQDD